jgi:predicted membrane-bound mannosyltransferase
MLLRIKQLKISTYGIYAFIIIAVATLLRIFLIAQGWPHSNADEDTMGIMAMHIAYNGEHPIFFYGQNYMGTLEAYLAAGFFRLFGASVFTLRLSPVLLFALFLTCMYLLTSLL